MTELKLVWPVNMTDHHSKIILSPAAISLPSAQLQDLPTAYGNNWDKTFRTSERNIWDHLDLEVVHREKVKVCHFLL